MSEEITTLLLVAAGEPPVAADESVIYRRARRRRRRQSLVAVTSICVLAVGLAAVLPRLTASEVRLADSPPVEDAPGCVPLPVASVTTDHGVLGVPLDEALRSGLRSGYEVTGLAAVAVSSDAFEHPPYAVSGLVRSIADPTAPPLVATWLSHHLVAAYAPADGIEGADFERDLAAWSADPAAAPERTHLYAVNDAAHEVSVWQQAPAEAQPTLPAVIASQRCAEAAG